MSFRNEYERVRDFLILHRSDYDYVMANFRWPHQERFNWALTYFDSISAQNTNLALWIVDEEGREEKYTYEEMSQRSNQMANFLRSQGVKKGDSLLLMVENDVSYWEIMLAAMKMGAIVIPTSPYLAQNEIQERINRERVRAVITMKAHAAKFDTSQTGMALLLAGVESSEVLPGWVSLREACNESPIYAHSDAESFSGQDAYLRYFVAHNGIKPQVIEHTQDSFAVGNLSTLYWMGLHPGDIHLAINAWGWSMNDWNNFLVPWSAEATIFVLKHNRFDAKKFLKAMAQYKVTTVCAPPTVWRLFTQEPLQAYDMSLRELLSTGEPLGAEVISKIYQGWGMFIRDGYGRTETSMLLGVPPEERGSFGTMGKPLPGHKVTLQSSEGVIADNGEICIDLTEPPLGLMNGVDLQQKFYRTGDSAYEDYAGNYTFKERLDSVFKCADYRVSPLELESVLKEHSAIVDVVVIPSAEEIRDSVPKALVALNKGVEPTKELALDIMNFSRQRLAPFKRIRRVEFMEIPRSATGEIMRKEMADREKQKRKNNEKAPYEFWEEDAKVSLAETWVQQLP